MCAKEGNLDVCIIFSVSYIGEGIIVIRVTSCVPNGTLYTMHCITGVLNLLDATYP